MRASEPRNEHLCIARQVAASSDPSWYRKCGEGRAPMHGGIAVESRRCAAFCSGLTALLLHHMRSGVVK